MICCRVRLEGQGEAQANWQAGMLRQTEQADLISYGLIPEFVGRFPVIAPLKVTPQSHVEHSRALSTELFHGLRSSWLQVIL